MPWNDASELVIGVTGQVYVAPIGTTLPTTTTGALNAAFVGLGYTTEDGVSFSVGKETQDIPAWQSFDPVKIIQTARQINASFGLQQWNENNVPLAFGGGSISGSDPNWKYTAPEPSDGLDERSMVIDVTDGDQNVRIILPRGLAVDAVETQFQRTATAVLPITFRALAPSDGSPIFTIYSDADGFVTGS